MWDVLILGLRTGNTGNVGKTNVCLEELLKGWPLKAINMPHKKRLNVLLRAAGSKPGYSPARGSWLADRSRAGIWKFLFKAAWLIGPKRNRRTHWNTVAVYQDCKRGLGPRRGGFEDEAGECCAEVPASAAGCALAYKGEAASAHLSEVTALQLSRIHILRSLSRSVIPSFSEMLIALIHLSLTNLLSLRTE